VIKNKEGCHGEPVELLRKKVVSGNITLAKFIPNYYKCIFTSGMNPNVMKTLLFTFVVIAQFVIAQPKMLIYRPGLTTAYINFSKDVYDGNELPKPIMDSAKSILAKYMGNDLSKRLTFSIAQVIDTLKYLKSEKKKSVPP